MSPEGTRAGGTAPGRNATAGGSAARPFMPALNDGGAG